MIKNKETITKRLIEYLPFIVYFCLIIIMNMKMSIAGDDKYFSIVLQQNSLWDWITNRYNTWSSRVIIEGIMVTLLNLGFNMWKILNISIFLILPYAIKKIFNIKKNVKLNWIICMTIFLIPASCYGDAGWVATSMNYLWPLAFGLLAGIPIKKNFNNEKMNIADSIICTISIIIACNQEQMAGVLAIIYVSSIFYNLIKKKTNIYLILCTALIILSLIFIISCPGVEHRKISEVKNWFPNYEVLNLIDKVQLGINSMMRYISLRGRIVFITMTALIMYAAFVTNKSKFCRIIAIIQFIGSMPLNFINRFIPENLIIIKDAINKFNGTELVISSSTNNIMLYIIFAYYMVVLVCIGISLYSIFKNTNKSIIALSILAVGIISRMVMGFSPTVFASAERTSIFLYASFILLIIYIWKHLMDNNKDGRLIYYLLIFMDIVSYIKNINAIF